MIIQWESISGFLDHESDKTLSFFDGNPDPVLISGFETFPPFLRFPIFLRYHFGY